MSSTPEEIIEPYQDYSHPGNSSKYHSGRQCIELGCTNQAGTYWSPMWCVKHNIDRLDRINKNLKEIEDKFDLKSKIQ